MGTQALMRAIAFYIVKSISDHIISIWAGEKKLSRRQCQSELYVCLYFKVHLTINSHTHMHTQIQTVRAGDIRRQYICSALRLACSLIIKQRVLLLFLEQQRQGHGQWNNSDCNCSCNSNWLQ